MNVSGLYLDDNRIADLADVVFPPTGVSTLWLTNNALRELPAGMFRGLQSSIGGRENLNVDLTGNPGAPFPVRLELDRLDAASDAPGRATVVVRVREAAPWTMSVRVTAIGGAAFVRDVEVPIGHLHSEPLAVADDGIALLRLGAAPPVPGTYKGMAVALGEPLRLFPLKDLDLERHGSPFELDLVAMFDATETGTVFTAPSSAAGVVAASVTDGTLTVTSLREGRGTVTVTARHHPAPLRRHGCGP